MNFKGQKERHIGGGVSVWEVVQEAFQKWRTVYAKIHENGRSK